MHQQIDPVLQAFQYVKAYLFFPKYCPKVRNWKNKMSGRSGKGQPLNFTAIDKLRIREGLKKLNKETQTSQRPKFNLYRGRLPATRGINIEQLNRLFK